MKFIIADDFGLTHGVNLAILECYKNNLITRGSLMTNQEYTNEAIDMIINNDLDFGLHFNLTQGNALSDNSILSKEFFYEASIEWIEEELNAQLKIIYDKGLSISHIDMHHNMNFKRDDVNDLLLKYSNLVRDSNKSHDVFNNDISDESLVLSIVNKNIDEIYLHPGYNDSLLESLSHYSLRREKELNVLINNKDIINIILGSMEV